MAQELIFRPCGGWRTGPVDAPSGEVGRISLRNLRLWIRCQLPHGVVRLLSDGSESAELRDCLPRSLPACVQRGVHHPRETGRGRRSGQEALARTYLRWEKVASYATPFVLRVTTNLVIDKLRRHTMARRLFTRQQQTRRAPTGSISNAPPQTAGTTANVVVLRYVWRSSGVEVAIVLGCTIGTVKTHASRGLASLRRTLKPVQFMADQETEKRL